MVTGYSEDALVEQPAIALLGELGWETLNTYQEFAHGASTLGRETKGEVILTQRQRPALARLNCDLPPVALDEAVAELQRDRSRMSLVVANREVYHALKNGVRVTVPDPEGEGEMVTLVRVIDWNTPENNGFLLCSQLWVAGEMHTRRPDLVGFVNGLPLFFVELKTAHGEEHWSDLTNVDFEALAAKCKIGSKRTMNEQLKGSVAQKVMAMVRQNRTRMDFLEHFQAMIEAYNAGSLNAEDFFQQLLAFAQNLNEEDARRVGEQLNEEESALFDLFTKPAIEMIDADRDKVKATAGEMLATLKAGKLVLDWRKRQQSRAEVRVTIERLLNQNLRRAYTPELFDEKATSIFQYVYESYYGARWSVFSSGRWLCSEKCVVVYVLLFDSMQLPEPLNSERFQVLPRIHMLPWDVQSVLINA